MARRLAIGDIHGCLDALRALEEAVGLTADDTLITLGDYVDRGPDSRGVVQWLIEHDSMLDLVPLRGNHEIMMLGARVDRELLDDWLRFGGDATLRSYAAAGANTFSMSDIPPRHWRFLQQRLLDAYETEHHLFVHANVDPNLPLADQPDHMLFWEKLRQPPRHASGKIMVCGHTSRKSGLPLVAEGAICIDTWAYGDGWLTCLDVDSGEIWQANQAGCARRLRLEELT